MKIPHLTHIVQAMQQTDFYPHAVTSVTHLETHISHVFLTGPYAYKVKKHVDFGFLDFSTLEKRGKYCRSEVNLNRRLSKNIYLAVEKITYDDGLISLSGRGRTIEYAVKMVQLRDARAMSQLLEGSGVPPQAVEALARRLVRFYETAFINSGIDVAELLAATWMNCEDNFRRVQEFSGTLFDEKKIQMVRKASRTFFDENKRLFQERIEQGFIRDCHGDLRTEHIYFTEDGIQIIDCIEFSERLRRLDIVSDLAFLIMDLDYRGFSAMGFQLLKTYMDLTRDADAAVLLNFYKCYRAIVRLKVSCLRLQELDPKSDTGKLVLKDIQTYAGLAHHYAVLFSRPRLWVVCGMPASGKSTVAGALAMKRGIQVFHSDVIRKALFRKIPGNEGAMPYGEGIYSEQATSLTYQQLLVVAKEALQQGSSVVIDATFQTRQRRLAACCLAREMSASILFVECQAPDSLIRKRLLQRETESSVSDARLFHFQAFKERFEPMDDIDQAIHISIDTSKPLKECLFDIFRFELIAY
jgi:hypothetical protein